MNGALMAGMTVMENENNCQSLDMRGLRCPLPVLKAHKALRSLAAGTLVVVLTDDDGAPKDFRDYCQTAGHELVSSSYDETDSAWHVTIRRKGD